MALLSDSLQFASVHCSHNAQTTPRLPQAAKGCRQRLHPNWQARGPFLTANNFAAHGPWSKDLGLQNAPKRHAAGALLAPGSFSCPGGADGSHGRAARGGAAAGPGRGHVEEELLCCFVFKGYQPLLDVFFGSHRGGWIQMEVNCGCFL